MTNEDAQAIANELQTVAGLLTDEGKHDHAKACRDIAGLTAEGAVSVDRAMKALGFYENLIGA